MALSELIIIGAGPAGLAAGIAAKVPAIILERNPFAGKKLLLSGKGQCNFTNAIAPEEFLQRLGEYKNFLKPAFYHFDNQAFIDLLEANACATFIREDGKVFPQSLQSREVRDTLLKSLYKAGQSIEYNTRVSEIAKEDDYFILSTADKRQYRCKKLILAGGGAAYASTGSDGNCYQLAAKLGHTIIPSRPALTNITVKNFGAFQDCAGISLKGAELRLGKRRYSGDLLFTHQGLSGPLILDNSHLFQPEDTIQISFIQSNLLTLSTEHKARKLSSYLQTKGIPKAVAQALLSHISATDKALHEYKHKDIRRICESLQQVPFTVRSLGGEGIAMGDYGGICLKEVKAGTMESKLIKGLYFAGELLAYTLPTGGFSIQMAVSTGMLAALLK